MSTLDEQQNPNTKFVQPQSDTPPQQAIPVAPPAAAAGYTPADPNRPAPAAGQPDVPAPPPSYGGDNSSTLPPPSGAGGARPEAISVSSAPNASAHMVKPPIDPRPYAYFAEHNPQFKELIDRAAEATGASPYRIAAHKWAESRGAMTSPDGADGEHGIMQFMPGTRDEIDPQHHLDTQDPEQALLLGGMLINKLDGKYGKDSPASVAAYNGSGPKARAYAQRLMGGNIPDSAFSTETGGSMTAKGIVQAGSQSPDAALKYMVQTAPEGMPMSDVWRHAEAQLVGAFISKGDMEGAQHARDFILQLSHTGSNQNLMAAHQALSSGNATAAAQFLAKAHAFFPDGTIGKFSTDGKNIVAQRLDENDPQHQLGPAFNVTPNEIAGLLNQTTDPNKYLTSLQTQQKANADASYKRQHGDYLAGLPQSRANVAAIQADSRQAVATQNNDTKLQVAGINAAAKAGAPDKAMTANINKETDTRYNELSMPDSTPDQRAQLSMIHAAVARTGATPNEADMVARGLSDRTLQLIKMTTGDYGVVRTGSSDRRPIRTIPKDVGDQLMPPQQAAPSPVGAGAATQATYQSGAPNLAGAQPAPASSAALPVSR